MFNSRDTVETLRESLYNMETQLIALYEEKQTGGSETEISSLRDAVASFEEQLNALYQEKSSAVMTAVPSETMEMIQSLEDQVKSLIDEKMSLEEMIEQSTDERVEMQKRARELGSALFEAAIVGRLPKAG